jgi:thiol-disulfide isomerase/thioredoxin
MKLFIILFFISNSTFAQTKKEGEFILKGKVNYSTDRYIYFVWRNKQDGFRFVDSAKVINGQFEFKGEIFGYNGFFYIKSDPNNFDNNDLINNVQVPIDNSVMNIKLKVGSFSKYKLIGCKACDELKLLQQKANLESEIITARNELINFHEKGFALDIKNMEQEALLFSNKIKKDKLLWCKKNINNSLLPYNLYKWELDFTLKEFKEFYDKASKNQKQSFYGMYLEEIVGRKENEENQIGKQAFTFEKMGFNNSTVSLQSINKKGYVILDFWGSWCGPCRASHPHLIKLFKKYKSYKLSIIGVAADNGNEEKWKKAIKEDGISLWSNVLEGEKKQNDSLSYNLRDEYLIHSYPTKILINPNGKIIGRFANDDLKPLEDKLKEIYKF